MKFIIKFLKVALLFVILGYLFYGFNLDKLDFSKIDIFATFITILILFIGQLILSVRFMKILKLKFKPSYETIVISNALDILLPARIGEVIKPIYLKKFYKYPYDKGFSSLFIERFFDVIMLFFIVIIWAYFYFSNPLIQKTLLSLAIFIIFVLMFFNSKFILNLLNKFDFISKTYKNINSLLKKSHIILFWSIVLWSIYLISYETFFSQLNLSLTQLIELFIFSTIALSIPLAPAGAGTFEGAIVFYLNHYGISKEEALLFATIYHLLIILVDLVMFYALLVTKNLSFKELKSLK